MKNKYCNYYETTNQTINVVPNLLSLSKNEDIFLCKEDSVIFEIQTNDTNTFILPLGYGSIYNHSDSPNIKWRISKSNNNFIEFYSLKEIESGEELCHSYGYRYWNSRKKRMI